MANELENELRDRILRALDNLRVDCPECECMDDDQYQCCTCGSGSGNGHINIIEYLRENPEIINDENNQG